MVCGRALKKGLLVKNRKLIYGVGINDADYKVSPHVNGVKIRCKFYQKWVAVLKRCYSKELHKRSPIYKGCSVCDEWIYFMNFKRWMEQQDWEGKELDKDLLVLGNKVYSPETCLFVDRDVNLFITENKSNKGEWPLGVHYCTFSKKFKAQCSSVIDNVQNSLATSTHLMLRMQFT